MKNSLVNVWIWNSCNLGTLYSLIIAWSCWKMAWFICLFYLTKLWICGWMKVVIFLEMVLPNPMFPILGIKKRLIIDVEPKRRLACTVVWRFRSNGRSADFFGYSDANAYGADWDGGAFPWSKLNRFFLFFFLRREVLGYLTEVVWNRFNFLQSCFWDLLLERAIPYFLFRHYIILTCFSEYNCFFFFFFFFFLDYYRLFFSAWLEATNFASNFNYNFLSVNLSPNHPELKIILRNI